MMKIKIAGVVFCCLMASGIIAQRGQNLSFGPMAGFGHTWMSNSPNSKYQPAGQVGVALTYSTAPHFGVGTELLYSIEGGRTETGATSVESRVNYIRVPLRLMYFFGNYGDRVRPKVTVGPSFGFLAGGEREIRNNGNLVSNVKASDIYKSFDAGITASAGLNYRLIKNTWFVSDVRFYNGLTNVSKSTGGNNKNRNIGLNIGVNFGIGTAK